MAKEYATDLKERQRIAAYYRERYKTDPAYRLKKVNCLRIRLGKAPRSSVEEIAYQRCNGEIVG